MGLGLSLFARPPRRFLLRSGFSIQKVKRWAEASLPIPGPMQRLYEQFEHDGKLYCRPTPLEEDVEFSVRNGLLHVSSKTSTLGPGYHAHLVQALQEIAKRNGFEWLENEDAFDETGYFANQDFGALQQENAKQAEAIAHALLEYSDEGMSNLRIGLPLGLDVADMDDFALTPLGPRSRAFFEKFVADKAFIYWDKELTANNRQNLAEALLWLEFSWAAPLDDRSKSLAETVLDLTNDIKLPWQSDVQALLTSEDVITPAATGIGYKRRMLRRRGTGNWALHVPGYFDFEAEDGNLLWWWGDRSIYFSSLSYDRTPDSQGSPALERDTEYSETVNGCHYNADFDTENAAQGDAFTLKGTVQAEGTVAILTVTCGQASDRDWALGILKSIELTRETTD